MSTSLVIPANIADKLAQRAETCASCKWRNKDKTGDIECRAHPPHGQVMLVPQQGPLSRPGMPPMVLQTFSTFPLIRDEHWCGEWSPKTSQ